MIILRNIGLVLVALSGPFLLAAQDRGDVELQLAPGTRTFMRFVEEVEEQTSLVFYLKEGWVEGIQVSVDSEGASLRSLLNRTLLPAGLHFYLDPLEGVYLSPGSPLVHVLPRYGEGNVPGKEGDSKTEMQDMTQAEERYLEGRKAGILETLQVGRKDASKGKGQVVVHGRISDEESGEALVGATLYLEDLEKGAVSDVDGLFSLVLPPGTHTLSLACMGMENRRYYLEVHSGGVLNLDMAKSLIALSEVRVEATQNHHVRGTQMGYNRLNYKALKEIPVVMGERDVLKVIQMLPGVQSVGEGSAGFNVRGSAADQNLIYVNKVPVYNINHLFGFFTSFNPDIIRDFSLYKSNLPASYGGRLSSFFDISTRQGNMRQYHARGGISPITGHLALEGPIQKEKSSFVLSARSTYSDWILKRLEDPDLRNSEAAFQDFAGVLTWKPRDKTLVKAFGYYSRDRFKLGSNNSYAYANTGASLNVVHRFSNRSRGDLALVYGAYDFTTVDQNIPAESYTHTYRIDHYELKADFNWLSLGRHKITYGTSLVLYDLNRGLVEAYGPYSYRSPVDLGREQGLEGGLYLADEMQLTPWLTLYAGLRYSAFAYLGADSSINSPGEASRLYHGPEPRMALNLSTGAHAALKASYNRVRQHLFMLSNTIAISPSDQWKLVDQHISPPYADQLSLGFYHEHPRRKLSTSMEIYHKWVRDVVEYRDGADFISTPHVEELTLQGMQQTYGAEFMLKKEGGKLNGWISYAYSRSFMQVDAGPEGESINQGERYPSNYDRPHHLNMVSTFKVNRRLSLSANLVYTTGRPVTYPLSIYTSEGMEFIDYAARNAYRIPDYFRMDVSINLEGNLKNRKLFHSFWMLNIYNLTGRRNAYSVFFQSEEGVMKGYKLSIFGQPIVTLSWNFKLGNYASE